MECIVSCDVRAGARTGFLEEGRYVIPAASSLQAASARMAGTLDIFDVKEMDTEGSSLRSAVGGSLILLGTELIERPYTAIIIKMLAF